jgi:hypothetical protein
MIRHTVVFTLKHASGSQDEKNFLAAASGLARIKSVKNFECLREVSLKNEYQFGLSMEFDNQDGYDFYNQHPDHVNFVKTRWIPEVNSFMEVDYVPYCC